MLGCPAPCGIANPASWLALSALGWTFASAFPVGFVSSPRSRELRRVGADLSAMEQTSHSAPSLSLAREDSPINYQGRCGCVYVHLAVSLFNFHVIWKQSLICLIFNGLWPPCLLVLGGLGGLMSLFHLKCLSCKVLGVFFWPGIRKQAFVPYFLAG